MSVLDENGEKIMRTRLPNEPNRILNFIRQFPRPKQFAMETCYNWPVFYELLRNEVDEFYLLHAKKLKSIIESQDKCDSHDADEMAYLTHVGYIPRSYIASAAVRQLRRFLRARVRLSKSVASLKNQIQAIVNANTFYHQRPKNFKDLFSKRGLKYLKELSLPTQEQFLVDELLKQISQLEHLKQRFDEHLKTLPINSKELFFLQSVPAMNGHLLKYIVLAEIDNIHRFKNSDALVAYAGLCSKDKSSGEKLRKGHLRTDCNEFLKWALIEAVTAAIRRDKGLRNYYREVKQRLDSSSARVATARKLLRSIYHVLKEQRLYYSETDRR